MKFSKKSRYGLRALVDIVVHSGEGQVPLNSIAERNEISLQYLEQVFASLRKGGIVKSVKGPQGGYFLSREAKEITMSEIIEAIDGDYRIEPEEMEDGGKTQMAAAIQSVLIDKVNEQLDAVLKSITLEDLAEDYYDRQAYGQNMYYI